MKTAKELAREAGLVDAAGNRKHDFVERTGKKPPKRPTRPTRGRRVDRCVYVYREGTEYEYFTVRFTRSYLDKPIFITRMPTLKHAQDARTRLEGLHPKDYLLN